MREGVCHNRKLAIDFPLSPHIIENATNRIHFSRLVYIWLLLKEVMEKRILEWP